MGDAVQIRHKTRRGFDATSRPYLVPILEKPYIDENGIRQPIPDCVCGRFHAVKTVHLWLGPEGECLVSSGVLEDLRLAGMPDLEVVGHSGDPPPINLNQARTLVDKTNRAIRPLTPLRAKGTE